MAGNEWERERLVAEVEAAQEEHAECLRLLQRAGWRCCIAHDSLAEYDDDPEGYQ